MIELRELTTIVELKEVQAIERQVWGMNNIPIHQTLTAVKNGGMMIGAYMEGKLVGFSYGFPGFKEGGVYLCSHMLGIDKEYRSQGIGEMLKRKQRDIAIAKGYDCIKWTFDPLETRNAYLNLTKLHGICYMYVENCYGDMQDGLNQGLPSDRFEVHWYLNSPHVTERKRVYTGNLTPLNTIMFDDRGLPAFKVGNVDNFFAEAYSLAVPKDFQRLKKESPERAIDWRIKTRKEFVRMFQKDYAAVSLEVADTHAKYIFVKKNTLKLGGTKR